MSDKSCYYETTQCQGQLWQCHSCREHFCQFHSHTTELGSNVECSACARERREAVLSGGEVHLRDVFPEEKIEKSLEQKR